MENGWQPIVLGGFFNQSAILFGKNFYVSIDHIYQFEFQHGI